jgi:hypothetical protein
VQSRIKALEQIGIDEPEMPACDAHYLIDYLYEVGPTQGDVPLSHAEILAWQQNIGITLQPWELRFIKRLSVEYLGAWQQAAELNCPVPWAAAPYAKIDARIKAMAMKNAIKEMDSL